MCESIEMMLLSVLSPVLRCQWHLSDGMSSKGGEGEGGERGERPERSLICFLCRDLGIIDNSGVLGDDGWVCGFWYCF